jgi:signal transduction histidine kinase/ligand-binding sensor domain-containing protein
LRSSNTSRDERRARLRPSGLLLGCLAAALCASVSEADAGERTTSQYISDEWGIEQGFPGGPVYAITQTKDGYLWIGSEKGLIRFDGRDFRLIQRSAPAPAALGPVLGLIASADGDLWLRLRSPFLLRYHDGRFENFATNARLPESLITAMWASKEGDILISSLVSGTLSFRERRFETLAPSDALPKSVVMSVAQTGNGDVWLGTRDNGLVRVVDGRVSVVTAGLPDRKVNCLVPGDGNDLWIGTDGGVVRWNGHEITSSGIPPLLQNVQALGLLWDRSSNLWIGTAADGLLRLSSTGLSTVRRSDAQSRGAITALFEDREGNVWSGNARGLDRLRSSMFVTYSRNEGLPTDNIGPVYVDGSGRTWFGTRDGGLYWLEQGEVRRVPERSILDDVVYSIAGHGEDVWVGRQRGGLTHLRSTDAGLTARTYTQKDGLAQNNIYAVHRSRDGAVWAATLSGGVSWLEDGRFVTYTTDNGLASNTVSSIAETGDGTIWFGTPGGLSQFSQGKWRSYTREDGLPSNVIDTVLAGADDVLWIGTPEGLAWLDREGIHTIENPPAALRGPILGIAEDASGSLWISGANSIRRVKRDALMHGSVTDADVREFGVADGLRDVEGVKRHRSVVADAKGRIWFSMTHGLSVVDSVRASDDSIPALTTIQGITADGQPITPGESVRIPPGRRRITFTYAGLSLSVPARVRYRYRLDGYENDWSPPTAAREVAYTNLRPGPYTFRVMSSNSDGLWNGPDATIGFVVAPMFWQTRWFQFATLLTLGGAAAALYRLRMRQVARQLNVRFEERLAERTRIAQDLHDTLLQGLVSASMQLHVAAEHVPAESPARPTLNRVLQLMAQVIDEGRNAVSGLRSSTAGHDDLEQAFCRVPGELGIDGDVGFRVIVEGHPRALHPIIRDEVYRIGREALVNAFRHSEAEKIELELDYASNQIRLLVRDNGRGIDEGVLRSGREGHWGLSGMRERAERIGAQLKVWSRAAAGTEVELSVPGHVAFQVKRNK